ncbi:hypothetical protein G7081_06185 [Vagococcus coleopterorum]|uniref:GrdX protein n=1 Tax=Vagococcus coleopterorum TaxID=2714946 RepID=A0A6G8AP38_9ENTE|nr:GrdX family protein [Vagococcus coleopterorum]QIL46695.1 hypothetical protein G7081_06185 [Vagococcus coleopterorum]
MVILTNNPKIANLKTSEKIDYQEVDYQTILVIAKRYVVEGKQTLLIHPLSGSIKPNETIYKTIILTDSEKEEIDLESLILIESAEAVVEKFLNNQPVPNWNEKILTDFAWVDYYIMMSTFERIGLKVS